MDHGRDHLHTDHGRTIVRDRTDVARRCGAVREELSARLDGERALLADEELEAHLSACPSCEAVRLALPGVNRRLRVAAATPVPDLTAQVLTAVGSPAALRERRVVARVRGLVALAGGAQLLLGVATLLAVTGPDLHAGRELGALQIALGAGLLLAAHRPVRAAGVLPIAGVVVLLTAVVAVVDVLAGATSLAAEAGHLGEVVGLLALWQLHRRTGGQAGTAARPTVPA